MRQTRDPRSIARGAEQPGGTGGKQRRGRRRKEEERGEERSNEGSRKEEGGKKEGRVTESFSACMKCRRASSNEEVGGVANRAEAI
eukprot:242447-Hanusia_phi.AAC.1